MTASTVLALVAAALSALLAGLYLAFSLAVMPALARLDDRTVVRTMQEINRVIVGPGFLLLFLGAPAVAVAAAVATLIAGAPALAVLVGAVLQVAGLIVTITANVPRNTALDRADPDDADDPEAVTAARAAFERPWVRAHTLRTALTTLGALALLL